MRIMNRNWGLSLAAAALSMVAVVRVASAAPTIEQSGSIVVFPKVLGTTERDTLIEISNSSNLMAHAHCLYVNAAEEGEWVETDFDLWLTKQQPTHWLARTGRRVNLFDPFGSDGSGFDPGLIPPVPAGFQGELRCYQVDDAGFPQRGNSLKGNATIIRNDGDVSRYNAIAIPGNPDTDIPSDDNILNLNNTASHAGEYDACPDTLTVSLLSEGSTDPVVEEEGDCAGGDCTVSTELTLVPCGANYEDITPENVSVSILVYNEYEQVVSASVEVDCWLNITLDDLVFQGAFEYNTLGTPGAHARFNPAEGNGAILGIAEELRTDSDGDSSWAAFNLHFEGNRFDAARDIDGNLLSSLACAGGENAGNACTADDQCPGSACINGVQDRIVIPLSFN